MRLRLFILTYILLIGTLYQGLLNAQCDFPSERLIKDQDTTIISFQIEGATNNNLSTNGICGVRLGFNHEYVGDLSIYLVSPSGQEVQLIGPSTIDGSPLTTFINWDVTFVPCGSPASPDQGLLPVWNNLGNWLQFTDYDGVYYPHNGCLEDLNSGPINGTWTLRIEDAVDFGEGVITDARLIFCDDDGIDCASCVAFTGEFTNQNLEICEGSPDLIFTPEVVYDLTPPPADLYDYRFIVLDVNGYVEIQETVDLTGFSPATYQVCGLSIENTQLPQLNVTFGMQKEEIENIIVDNSLCADLTNDCISITIREVEDTILISESICEGSTFELEGVVYDSAGMYVVNPSDPSCDTITLLNLQVYPIHAEIAGGDQLLTCANNRISLDGSASTAQDSISYLWSTDGGLIRTDPTQESIIVSQVGRYYLDVTSNGCIARDTIDITGDGTAIEIDLTYDTIDCINTSTLLEFDSSIPVTSVSWSGTASFNQMGNNIEVLSSGEYRVTVTGDNGCVASDTATIVEDTDVEDPQFSMREITCVIDSVTPGTTFTDSMGLSFVWTGPNAFSSTQQNPLVGEPGLYEVTVTGMNGCSEVHNTNIGDARRFPVLNTLGDTLDCANNQVTIEVNSNIATVEYNWEGPNGFSSNEQNPIVDQEGTYIVTVTTNESCSSTAQVEVAIDERLPMVTVMDQTINCVDNGLVSLNVTTDANNPVFSWRGPGGYMETGDNPPASIIGDYRVTVTGSNGCARTATMSLLPGNDVPDVTFFSDVLDCDQPTVEIIPSSTTPYTFEYSDPIGATSMMDTLTTNIAGAYEVRVSEGACFSDYIHIVEVDSVFPELTFDLEEIDCDSDSIMLNFTSNTPLRQINWMGPNSFTSNIESPFVKEPGDYTVSVTGDNGCHTDTNVMVVKNVAIPQILPSDATLTCDANEVTLTANLATLTPRTYRWEGPDGFFSTENSPVVAAEGQYQVTITASNGCVNDTFLIVSYDTIPPSLDLVVDTVLTCQDPISTLEAMVDQPIRNSTWIGPGGTSAGGLTLDVDTPGLWTVNVTNNAGCVSFDTVTVGSDIVYPAIITQYNTIDCNNSDSEVTINRDPLVDSIVWQAPILLTNDIVDFSTNQPGDYSYSLFSSNGCDTTVRFTIPIDTIPPDYDLVFSDTLTCAMPVVDLSVITSDSLIDYEWSGQGVTSMDSIFAVSSPGIYYLSAGKANGCYATDSIVVPADTVRPEIVAVGDTMSCRTGRRAILEVSTNLDNPDIIWRNDAGFTSDGSRILVTEAGFYSVEVIAGNGCTSRDVVEVVEDFMDPRVFVDEVSYLLCDSTESNLSITSDASDVTYNWFGPNGFFSEEQAPLVDTVGTYIVYASGTNGCLIIDSTQVVVDTRLPQYNLSFENIICSRDTAEINLDFAVEDNTWNWRGPNGFVSDQEDLRVTEGGMYYLTIQGANRCIVMDTAEIEADTISPSAIATTDEIIQCTNRTIMLDGSASTGMHNLSFLWTTSDGNIIRGEQSPLVTIEGPGTYDLQVFDNTNNCSDNTSLTIEGTAQEFLDFTYTAFDPSCPGFANGAIFIDEYIGGYGPYELSVDGAGFAVKQEVRFLEPGTYELVLRDSLGCEVNQEVVISEPREIDIDLGPDLLIDFGDSVDILVMTNIPEEEIALLRWSPSEEVDCINCLVQNVGPLSNTLYQVSLTDTNGCVVEDNILVRVKETPDLTLANVFKPESDLGNSVYYIPQTKGIDKVNFLSIFDRWGNRMYHAEDFIPGDSSFGWDGNFQGQRVNAGVFAVIAKVTLINNEEVIIKSDLTLIR